MKTVLKFICNLNQFFGHGYLQKSDQNLTETLNQADVLLSRLMDMGIDPVI